MINGKESLEFDRKTTERGFAYTTFTDLYKSDCSIQMSSIASAKCIWLGVDLEPVDLNNPNGPKKQGARMHLNAKQAKQLCKEILNFLKEND